MFNEVMATGEIHFKWLWEQAVQEERIVLSILAQKGGEKKRSLSLVDREENYRHYGFPYNSKKVLQALSSASWSFAEVAARNQIDQTDDVRRELIHPL